MNSKIPPAYLHLGVHRTGTSSFQQVLNQNRAGIEAAGTTLVAAARDSDVGHMPRLAFPGKGDTGAQAATKRARTLAAWALTPDRPVLLSDENMLGPLSAAMKSPPFPTAESRLRFLAEGLARPVARVLLVIRPQADFLASAYRKRCEFRAIRPFEFYARALMREAWSWAALVERIAAALEPREIVVVPYAARPDEAGLLSLLAPELDAGPLAPLEAARNQSVTDAACRAIQRRFHAGEALSRTQVDRIAARHADDLSGPPVAAFTPAADRALARRYEEDLDILSTMAGVRLIDPPHAAARVLAGH